MRELLWSLYGLHIVAEAICFVLLVGVFYFFFLLLVPGRRLPFHRKSLLTLKRSKRAWWHILFLVPKSGHARFKFVQQMLRSCGVNWSADNYIVVKRAVMTLAFLLLTLVAVIRWLAPITGSQTEYLFLFIGAAMVLAAGLSDSFWLAKLKQLRREKIMRDVDALSRQLLYYSGLDVNLHHKLMRCLPLASSIREEWYMLITEWYQGAEYALRKFRERVATDEAIGFAETINALRQYDHDRYYDLLKERIADYKEKLELLQDGRKEAVSYLLFVMSGIPILFTFRLFIYPWVAEGQKLFQSLS